MMTEHLTAVLAAIAVAGCTGPALQSPDRMGIGFCEVSPTKVDENESEDLMERGFSVSSPGLMDNSRAVYSDNIFKTGVYWPSDRTALDFFAVFPPEYEIMENNDGRYMLTVGSELEPFDGTTDILVAVRFEAEETPVPLEFIHPLCFISRFRARLADDAPAWFSVFVEDITVSGIPGYGDLTYPSSDGQDFAWTYAGDKSFQYCEDAGVELVDSELKTLDGEGCMLIPTSQGKYTATVHYRLCSFGQASDILTGTFELELAPGKRGVVDIAFNPPSVGDEPLNFKLTLEPWDNDETYNHIIKLY